MSIENSRFLRACRREQADATPVWFMRQAGRSLPEYRALREKHSFMEICHEPELCAEVTLQPVRRLKVDAAIMFADIMTPLIATGVGVELVDNVGPVVADPIRSLEDVQRIRGLEPEQDIPYITASIKLLKRELAGATPLIGFAGAPFTLAAYLIEGKTSRNFTKTKAMMYGQPNVWHALMARLTTLTIDYLRAKAAAGVDALQLFDSWIGCVSPQDYVNFVQPYTSTIIRALREAPLPFIHFGTNTATLLPLMKTEGAPVIGADWRLPLDHAWQLIGHDKAIQGNLDPAVLLGPWEFVAKQAKDVLNRAGGRPGHIFNLGHGIFPETPVDNLARLVEYVHEQSAR